MSLTLHDNRHVTNDMTTPSVRGVSLSPVISRLLPAFSKGLDSQQTASASACRQPGSYSVADAETSPFHRGGFGGV